MPAKSKSLKLYLEQQLQEAIMNQDEEGIKMTEAAIQTVKADENSRKEKLKPEQQEQLIDLILEDEEQVQDFFEVAVMIITKDLQEE